MSKTSSLSSPPAARPPSPTKIEWHPPNSSPLSIHVVGAKPGTKIEVVPGRTFLSLDNPDSIETIGLTEMVPAGAGTWRAVVRVCPRRFTLSPLNMKRLGIAISMRGLARLIDAGFVAGERVTPGVRQFDYFDYRRHEAAVAADPEFWERKQTGHNFTNRQRYQQSL